MKLRRYKIVTYFFLGLLLLIAFEMLRILSPFAAPLFWAATLTFAFYPLYQRLHRVFGKNESAAAGLTTAIILLAVVPLVAFLAYGIAAEALDMYRWTEIFVKEQRYVAVFERLRAVPVVEKMAQYAGGSTSWRENLDQILMTSVKWVANASAKQAATITKNLVVAAFHTILTFFLVFFLLRDGQRIYRFLYEITPLEEANKREVFRKIGDTFAAVIRGQMVTSIVQSLIAGAIYWALGLPVPLFFAALTFIVSLIPVFGAATVWAPLAGYLAAIGQWPKAIALALLGVFVISLIDNILKPILIGEKTKLPYMLLFLGILGGLQVYGMVGVFLAPAVLSLFFVLVKIYRENV